MIRSCVLLLGASGNVLAVGAIVAQTAQNLLSSDEYQEPGFCKTCHRTQYDQWKGTMHAYSSSDPFYEGTFLLASKETNGLTDHFCSRCHTPIGELAGEVPPADHSRLSEIAKRGVQCDFCHTLQGHEGIGNAQYIVRPGEIKLGPFGDGEPIVHKATRSEFHTRPEFCGTCHNVNHPLNGLPLEKTYTEWRESPYNTGDPASEVTCQDCHMTPGPGVTKPNPGKASQIGDDRPHVWSHDMVGGGGVAALVDEVEIMRAAEAMLKAAAVVSLKVPESVRGGDQTQVQVGVTNVGAGHDIPTGVTELREMWLELTVSQPDGNVLFTSGYLDEMGEIMDGAVRYGVVVADAEGNPTPKFWLAASQISDHRIPPKRTVVETFVVPIPKTATGPLEVRARLLYRGASPSVLRLGLGADSKQTLPVVEMASAEEKIQVLR